MYCRLQGYPSSHLISYSVHDPRWFSRSCGQFSGRSTSGCPAWFLWVIIAVLITLTHQHMSNVTAIINGNTFEADLETIAKILGMVSDTMSESIVEEVDPIEEELLPFNTFTVKELTPHFGDELSQEIVDTFEKCARRYFPDFRNIIGIYKKCATIEQRQLLKTVSAVYRLKFGKYVNKMQAQSSLRSFIKYATICPHCGATANAFVIRLTKEGLM